MNAPFFLGVRSPGLGRMQRMSSAELREHIDRLIQERSRITTRLEARSKAAVKTQHDTAAAHLEQRLEALIRTGEQLLQQKQSGQAPRSPGRGYGSGSRPR